MTPARQRLPARRECHTETLAVDGQSFEATVGFEPEDNSPRELFLKAGKEGSLLNAMLDDAAVVISVALQHGVPAQVLAKSIGRLPGNGAASPSNPTHAPLLPASPIGAALDLLQGFEEN